MLSQGAWGPPPNVTPHRGCGLGADPAMKALQIPRAAKHPRWRWGAPPRDPADSSLLDYGCRSGVRENLAPNAQHQARWIISGWQNFDFHST